MALVSSNSVCAGTLSVMTTHTHMYMYMHSVADL